MARSSTSTSSRPNTDAAGVAGAVGHDPGGVVGPATSSRGPDPLADAIGRHLARRDHAGQATPQRVGPARSSAGPTEPGRGGHEPADLVAPRARRAGGRPRRARTVVEDGAHQFGAGLGQGPSRGPGQQVGGRQPAAQRGGGGRARRGAHHQVGGARVPAGRVDQGGQGAGVEGGAGHAAGAQHQPDGGAACASARLLGLVGGHRPMLARVAGGVGGVCVGGCLTRGWGR